MRTRRIARPGFTLVELLVALVVLGVSLGAVVLALDAWTPVEDPARSAIADARARAIAEGRPVRSTVRLTVLDAVSGPDTSLQHVTAMPDGSVIVASALGFDRLTGRPRSEADR